MYTLSTRSVQMFKRQVYREGEKAWRSMPWRETDIPYRILVSEMMLQQTQVSRVRNKYEPFLRQFPSTAALAAASRRDVLRAWAGLGYNRRAVLLHQACQFIEKQYNGTFPRSKRALQALPGVGHATAAAVCNYAFAIPEPFLETNIRQVLVYHFFTDREGVAEQELFAVAEQVIDEKYPREWHWALMDYGAALKEQYGNLNKYTRAYTKQSPFEGSRRQKRSHILQCLLGEECQLHDLEHKLDIEGAELRELLGELEQEGFLVRDKNGEYRVREE